MAISVNGGANPEQVLYNGNDCEEVWFNGVKVWEKSYLTATITGGRFIDGDYWDQYANVYIPSNKVYSISLSKPVTFGVDDWLIVDLVSPDPYSTITLDGATFNPDTSNYSSYLHMFSIPTGTTSNSITTYTSGAYIGRWIAPHGPATHNDFNSVTVSFKIGHLTTSPQPEILAECYVTFNPKDAPTTWILKFKRV